MKSKSNIVTLMAALAISSAAAVSQLYADPAATGAGGATSTPVGPSAAAAGAHTGDISTSNPGNGSAAPQGTPQNPISPTLIPQPAVPTPGNQAGSGNSTANQQGTGNAAVNHPGSGNTAASQPGSGNTATNQPGSGNTTANQPGSGNTMSNQPGSGNQAPH